MEQTDLFDGEADIGDDIGAVEAWSRDAGFGCIVGVDEAGRGPLAGPVHTAAVALDPAATGEWIEKLNDSKQLTEEERCAAFDQILAESPASAIEAADAEEIDAINILQATRRAMVTAVESVREQLGATVDCVFVDGNVALEVEVRQRTVVDGDARSRAIAAASILAKVSRDRAMVEYGERWSAYNFASNKGYPTPDHREALERHGPCPIHRRSFGGVDD